MSFQVLSTWFKDLIFLFCRIGFDLASLAYLSLFALPIRLLFNSKVKKRFNSILITGGSAGIGAQLAKVNMPWGSCIVTTPRRMRNPAVIWHWLHFEMWKI